MREEIIFLMQTKNILISVIIPYYKKKNYIYSSLKSVLKQSHKKIEVIIIYRIPLEFLF